MWCRQGERCKPIFIAGKNLVEHQEQFQDWARKWLSVRYCQVKQFGGILAARHHR